MLVNFTEPYCETNCGTQLTIEKQCHVPGYSYHVNLTLLWEKLKKYHENQIKKRKT